MSNLKKGLISSGLLVAESILNKLVGLVSTLVLARVLVPEDFGIVAIATIVLGLLDVLGQTGSQQYLLRTDTINADMVNTSWTINGILKAGLALLLVVATPFITDFYGDERLSAILYVFAALICVRCLGNPGGAFLRREQNYLPIVKLNIISKSMAVTVAISIALIYENYWALVLGQCASGLTQTLGSYFIHPHRPRVCFKNIGDQYYFSVWVIPQAIFGYARTQLDTFIVSTTFGQASLGSYHVLKYLAFIPSRFVIIPATEPLLVELTKVKNNKDSFAKQYNVSFLATIALAIAITAIMIAHNQLIVRVLLGEQWLEYSLLLASFSLLIPALVILHQARRVLLVYGKTKQLFYYEVISFCFIYGILIFVGFNDIEQFTLVRVSLENIASLTFMVYISAKYTSITNTIRLLALTTPLVIAAAIASVLTLSFATFSDWAIIQLVIVTLLFGVIFMLSIVLMHLLGMQKTYEWGYFEALAAKLFKQTKAWFKR